MTRIATDRTLVDQALTERVIGVFFSTYNELGWGFLESVYESAFAIALREAGLEVERQRLITVRFHGHVVGDFKADLVIEDRLIVEIKSVQTLTPSHDAQLTNYLKATGIPLGLLVNFGPKPSFRRKIFTPENPNLSASSV